ncbi:MAG: hypothetical protein ABWK05_07695 [Pyrobaculum sp.]
MSALAVANVIQSPLSGWLLTQNWLGLAGWRWVFIVEGIPSVLWGLVVLFAMPDWPKEAGWLTQEEKTWLEAELARERVASPRADKLEGRPHTSRPVVAGGYILHGHYRPLRHNCMVAYCDQGAHRREPPSSSASSTQSSTPSRSPQCSWWAARRIGGASASSMPPCL